MLSQEGISIQFYSMQSNTTVVQGEDNEATRNTFENEDQPMIILPLCAGHVRENFKSTQTTQHQSGI